MPSGQPLAIRLADDEAADCKAYDAFIDLSQRGLDALLAPSLDGMADCQVTTISAHHG